jgi:hypothetical protein
MLMASASGLDPDISPANAALQVARVARARGVPPADINALLERRITGRSLRIFGEPRVNVLDLNLALQRELSKTRSPTSPAPKRWISDRDETRWRITTFGSAISVLLEARSCVRGCEGAYVRGEVWRTAMA